MDVKTKINLLELQPYYYFRLNGGDKPIFTKVDTFGRFLYQIQYRDDSATQEDEVSMVAKGLLTRAYTTSSSLLADIEKLMNDDTTLLDDISFYREMAEIEKNHEIKAKHYYEIFNREKIGEKTE